MGTIIRFADVKERERKRRSGKGSRSGRFTTREVYQDRAPAPEPADSSGKLIRFQPQLVKNADALATEYSVRLGRGEIARVSLTVEGSSAWIDWVYVPAAHRGSGVARRLMNAVTADADAVGASLGLEARACAGLSQEALEAWYARFGFAPNGELGKFGPELTRAPRRAQRRAA